MLTFGTKTTSNAPFDLHDVESSEVIFSVRKHWITYVSNIVLHLFGMVLFFAMYMGLFAFEVPFFSFIESFFIVFIFFIWTSLFYFLTLQYLDVWYVVRDHLVAVDQKQMFDREVSVLRLDKIQDISYTKEGVFAILFNYGDITVETAGSKELFVMRCVKGVENVVQQLTMLRDEYHPNL